MKTKTTYYKIGQSLPPRHWYQRRVGWFSKSLVAVFALTVFGGGAYGQMMLHQNSKMLTSQSGHLDKLQKTTEPLTTSTENIIDVQFVLDKWAKDHRGETWSVTAKSIDGPGFHAQLNSDQQYESGTAGHLLMTLPLFDLIPAEQHKSIRLDSGKTMADCVNLMIRLGDPKCGNEVAGYVDFRKAGTALEKRGIKKTALSSTKAQTTTDDMAAFLIAAQGNELPNAAKDMLIKSLREQYVRRGIPAACPGCVVANQASESGVIYDAAIVQYSGGTYVLSIFTKDGSLTDISELAGRIQQKILDTVAD